VRTEPDDLQPGLLAEVLRLGWRIAVSGCEYVPVGGGSHHWRVVDSDSRAHWITADDLKRTSLGALRAALDAAIALHDRGHLEFVVAPIPTLAGESLRPLGPSYAVAVYPYLEARSLLFGEELPEARAAELAGLLARLHSADLSLAPGLRQGGAEVPGRAALELALHELDSRWTGGPYSEPAREAVSQQQTPIRELLRLFDELSRAAGTDPGQSVVSHGEPHPANLLLDGDRLLLIDWDTVARGAPERDLWWLDGQPAALELYERASARMLDPARMRLYRVRWTLDDIASFVQIFRSPHERNPDTERWWTFAGRLTQAAETAAARRTGGSLPRRPQT
jgi:spectinomycin phosphotransferase